MRPLRRHGAVLAALVVIGAGCSGDDGAADAEDAGRPATSAAPASAVLGTTAPPSSTASTTEPPATAPETDATTTTAAPTTLPVEDTGVPGLDSADAFCAAWSRFGGTWQVALAAGAFGGPEASTQIEVVAAPVVGAAYDALFDAWPDELAGEEAVVADAYFGAFLRRSSDALAALDRAGAGPDELDALAEVWVGALATRDPSNPVIEVEVPAALSEVVDAAAADFASQRTPLVEDPSMVITASTPLTDDYLATACPDQGALTGSDVVDG